MTVTREVFPQFREELRDTWYPFADSATLVADDGYTLDRDTFLDGVFYPINAAARLHLAAVEITSRAVTLTIADANRTARGVASFDPISPPEHLRFTDDYNRPVGLLVSEPLLLSRLSAGALGRHGFAVEAAEFAATVVIPVPGTGVRGLLTANNELLTNDVWLIGDNGVVVREEDGHIRVDIVGDPLFVRQLCGAVNRFDVPRFIRTVNGCPPDQYGNYNLTVGAHFNVETIVRIHGSNDGLVIEAIGDRIVDQG